MLNYKYQDSFYMWELDFISDIFGLVRVKIAGKKNKSANRAPNIVTAARKPKSLLGRKFEVTITRNPAERINDVDIIALPVVNKVFSFASL